MRLGRWELRWNRDGWYDEVWLGTSRGGNYTGTPYALWWLGPLELWHYA